MGLLDDAIREHLDLKRRRGADPTEVERSEREALGPVRRTPERVPGDGPALDAPELDAPEVDAPEVGEGPSEHEPDVRTETGRTAASIYDDGLVSADEPGAAAFAPDEPDLDEPSEPPSHRLDHSTLPGPVGADDDESSWSYDEPSAAVEPAAGTQDDAVPPPHRADSARLEGDAGHTAEYDVAAALSAEPGAAEPALPDGEAVDARACTAPPHEPGTPPAEPDEEDEDVLEETPEFLQDTPDHDRLWFEQRPPRDFDFDG